MGGPAPGTEGVRLLQVPRARVVVLVLIILVVLIVLVIVWAFTPVHIVARLRRGLETELPLAHAPAAAGRRHVSAVSVVAALRIRFHHRGALRPRHVFSEVLTMGGPAPGTEGVRLLQVPRARVLDRRLNRWERSGLDTAAVTAAVAHHRAPKLLRPVVLRAQSDADISEAALEDVSSVAGRVHPRAHHALRRLLVPRHVLPRKAEAVPRLAHSLAHRRAVAPRVTHFLAFLLVIRVVLRRLSQLLVQTQRRDPVRLALLVDDSKHLHLDFCDLARAQRGSHGAVCAFHIGRLRFAMGDDDSTQ